MLQWDEQTLGDDRVETTIIWQHFIFSVNPSYGFSRIREKYIRTEYKFYERNGDVVNYDAGREKPFSIVFFEA